MLATSLVGAVALMGGMAVSEETWKFPLQERWVPEQRGRLRQSGV